MEKGVVTIILSIYNVEQYLERCIKSVVNQTYTNLEIILVDDGSPDRCPEICEEWAKKDKRIKVIHKKNAGLGFARNTGIENATGEYICFFDSDDYIALDTIEKAYNCITNHDADIVLFGFCHVDSNGRTKKCTVPKTPRDLYQGVEVQNYILPNLIAPDFQNGKNANLWMSAWACMYSVKVISDSKWRFVSERQFISEDVYSLMFLYKELRRVSILPETLYFYCENGTSLTHTYRKDRYEKNKLCYEACIKACDSLGYNQDVKERLASQYMSNIIGALKLIILSDCDTVTKKNEVSRIITDTHFQSVIHSMNISKETIPRKLLFLAMRKKNCEIVYQLVKIKS